MNFIDLVPRFDIVLNNAVKYAEESSLCVIHIYLINEYPWICHCERSEAISQVLQSRLLRHFVPRNDIVSEINFA